MSRPDGISVVIPYFNRQRFIDECLESVFHQTLPAREVIVVDDASSDREQRRYLDRFEPRVTIVDLPRNGGPAAARNAGIAAARGEWIAFNDSDDVWEADKLAVQAQYLAAHPDCDGVHTAMRAILRHGGESVSDPLPPRLLLEDALRHNMIRVQSLIIRRSVLDAIGGFDPSLRLCEDDDLGIRLALGRYRIDYLAQPLTRLRRQGHGHLIESWRPLMRGKVAVAWKHRKLLEQVLGRGATRRRVALSVRKAGFQAGGALGRALRLGGWLLGGLESATD